MVIDIDAIHDGGHGEIGQIKVIAMTATEGSRDVGCEGRCNMHERNERISSSVRGHSRRLRAFMASSTMSRFAETFRSAAAFSMRSHCSA